MVLETRKESKVTQLKVNYRIYCFRSHRNNACLLPVKIIQKSLLVSSHSIINKQKRLFQYLHSSYKNCADSMILAKKFSKYHTHNFNSYLNGYTKRRCTKYKLLLTISDISLNLEKAVFKVVT